MREKRRSNGENAFGSTSGSGCDSVARVWAVTPSGAGPVLVAGAAGFVR